MIDFEGGECEAFPASRAWSSEDRSSGPGWPSQPSGLDFAGNELTSKCKFGMSKGGHGLDNIASWIVIINWAIN